MYDDDINRDFSVGNVTLKIRLEWDYDGDYSYLGKFVAKPEYDSDNFTYDRREGVVLLPKFGPYDAGAWRDKRGRIVADPGGPTGYEREHRYIRTSRDAGADSLKYAFQDAERLDRLANGYWGYTGIIATVYVDGAEIAQDSLWGIESDSDASYGREIARQCASEALAQTREWLKRRAGAAA